MSDRIDNVSALKQANVYFDGKCVSHTVLLADGSKKTLGVILPSKLTFHTGAPEQMEVVAGRCRVRLPGAAAQEYSAGQTFAVPGQASFEIETLETLHYVCHYG